MITFQSVAKRYKNGREALTNVSLHVAPGEMVFLTGRSGAGKSTVLKLIALLERPTRGQVIVSGEGTARLPARRVPAFRRRVGVVFQDHRLLVDRPVFDNVALPLVIRGFDTGVIERRVRAALDSVGLLGKETMYPLMLSGGEQQRVGIARAIVTKPALLIADEPTGNLDPQLARDVMQVFERFNQVGVTVLVATHAIDLIRQMKHRIIHLDHGRLSLDQPAGFFDGKPAAA